MQLVNITSETQNVTSATVTLAVSILEDLGEQAATNIEVLFYLII